MSEDRVIYPPRNVVRNGKTVSVRNPADYILGAIAFLALFSAVYSMHVAHQAWNTKEIERLYEVIPFWILGPPIWFWCDYFLVYRSFGDKDAFDSFKHAQHVSLAIWVAVGFLLGGLTTSDHMKKPEPKPAIACSPALSQ